MSFSCQFNNEQETGIARSQQGGSTMSAKATKARTPFFHASSLRALTFCLGRSRFSILLLVGGLGLLVTDQGQDLLTGYAEDGKTLTVAMTAMAWALSVWGWCRALLNIRFDEVPSCRHCYNYWRRWLPRFLGGLAFVALMAGAWKADQYELLIWAAIGFAIFILFVASRRTVYLKTANFLNATRRASMKKFAKTFHTESIDPDSKPPYDTYMEAIGMPNGLLDWRSWQLRAYLVAVLYALFVVTLVSAFWRPIDLGWSLGPMVLFFLWAAVWLPFGSLMSYKADRWGIPLLTGLAIISAPSSCWNDNHEIRRVAKPAPLDARPGMTMALDSWAKANPPSRDKPTPFVVVATAGGGIRAAYWTGTVLGNLHDEAPDLFPRRTFALSGVSGGSIGATVYRALLDTSSGGKNNPCRKSSRFAACAQEIIGADYLGPLSAALLYPDLGQRFWPFPQFPDRAAAFEETWETVFRKKTGDDRLTLSLAGLASDPWAPALFLNATWSDAGRRLVASNLRVDKTNKDEREVFERSNDQLEVLGRDLALSTAAHNSARFPYVSPPGMWKDAKGNIAGRLQDGGLFENYGAETAIEILDMACRRFACTGQGSAQRRRIQPLVILISSDPLLHGNLAASRASDPIGWGYEVLSTPNTYEQVRNGRAAETAARLERWTNNAGGQFFHLRMCKDKDERNNPPLGWALSDKAKTRIGAYLSPTPPPYTRNPGCYAENWAQRQDLLDRLR
jgi:hypothetical protein